MATVNVEIVVSWYLGSGNTGLDGNMTATLTRFPTAGTSEAATETVTITEVGSGFYTLAFTPTLAYTYHLNVVESSLLAEADWSFDVGDAPATATAANAYCAEADVARIVQMGDWTSSTPVTETEVLTFMRDRAAEIYASMAIVVGDSAPGPSSYAVTINTSTDKGAALSYLCSQANATAAAADVLKAGGAGEEPAASSREIELLNMYQGYLDQIKMMVDVYVGGTAYAEDHIDEGRVTVDSFTARTQELWPFDGNTEW